ncbi:MAG: hypothetical protein RJA09_2197 [Pseudomonadota bacterium]
MFAPFWRLRHCCGPLLVFCCATAWAESTPWPQANHNVAQNPRGHIDIVRWEQAQGGATAPPQAPPTTPWDVSQAIRAAQAQRPDLLHNPGLGPMDLAQRRLDALALALQVKKAWYTAIAAQQVLGLYEDHAHAAEASAELGRRMVQVGNWSDAKALPTELNRLDAQTRLAQARLAAETARMGLWQLTGGPGGQAVRESHLPSQLPPLPTVHLNHTPEHQQQLVAAAKAAHPTWPWLDQKAQQALRGLAPSHQALAQQGPTQAWAQGAPVVGTAWTHPVAEAAQAWAQARALERQIEAGVVLAWAQWRHRHQLHQTQTQMEALQARVQDETLLRYNGMLASTWDLLGAAQNRLLAQVAAVDGQLNAWLALSQLEGVQLGLPYAGAETAPGNPSPRNPSSAGH